MNTFDVIILHMRELVNDRYELVSYQMIWSSIPSPSGCKIKLDDRIVFSATFDHELCLLDAEWRRYNLPSEYDRFDISDPADLDRFLRRLALSFGGP